MGVEAQALIGGTVGSTAPPQVLMSASSKTHISMVGQGLRGHACSG